MKTVRFLKNYRRDVYVRLFVCGVTFVNGSGVYRNRCEVLGHCELFFKTGNAIRNLKDLPIIYDM